MSKMNKFQAFRERNRKSNGYLLRKVSFNVAYKIVVWIVFLDFAAIVKQDFHQFHGRA
jgi:multiple sugar transport system permease protein